MFGERPFLNRNSMSAIFGIKRLPDWAQPQLGKTFPASLAKWTTRVLVLILAWTLGRLVWFWVPSPPPSPTSATAVATTAGQQQPAYQLDQLVNRHFFGRYNAAPAPVVEAPAPVVEAPRTKLNLTLVAWSQAPSRIAVWQLSLTVDRRKLMVSVKPLKGRA